MKNYLFIALGALILLGCGDTKKSLEKEFMQTARGEVGEIILVMDSTQYASQVGDAIKTVFREPMSGLPQDEPLFNISKAGPGKLNNVLKSAKNMIFVMTLDSKTYESDLLRKYFTSQSLNTIQRDTTQFYIIHKDEFAKGQVVLYLFSRSEDQLVSKLMTHKDQLQDLFESTERTRIKSRLFKKQSSDLENVIAETQPFRIRTPYGWDQAKNLKNFYWMRFLESDKEQNVFVYYEPYTNPNVFENIPALRDKITESFLRDSEKNEIYITRQERPDIKAIFTETVDFNGRYAVKARGLWKYSDISGGGPYISYTIVDEEANRLYYIEGFVYAPSTKKKNYIRELDAILSTFDIP